MTSLVAAFMLSFAAAVALESRPLSLAPLAAPWRATAIRLLLHLALFAAAFALSWRPWHAAFVACAIAFLFGQGSAMKLRLIGEPVAFSDFALVKNAIRHPRLYYAEKLAEPPALALFAGLAAATVVWFALEPVSPAPVSWIWLAAPPAVVAVSVAALRSQTVSSVAQSLVGSRPQLTTDAVRFGVLGAMAIHWAAWRRQARPSAEARALIASAPAVGRPAGAPVVVAIQCESFVDVAARGRSGPELPAFRALAREALAHGRCAVPAAEGAYTMRSEFAFLTGLPGEALGLDAFDPYLTLGAYAQASLARRLAAAGWRTVFLHPYDARFFGRDALVPRLGFESFLDARDFPGAERFGPYVADAAIAERLAGEIAAADRPTFLFAVTIENHGPWGPGRLPGVDDPERQYALHLENADRMLGRVAESLRASGRPGLLAAYGDHAPARSVHPLMSDRGSTDYLVWDPRAPRAEPAPGTDIPLDAVGRIVRDRTIGS